MTEGCDGGWPLFHGYLAENSYLVSEECAPYKGSTKGHKCADHQDCPPMATVEKSYFVGGGYG